MAAGTPLTEHRCKWCSSIIFHPQQDGDDGDGLGSGDILDFVADLHPNLETLDELAAKGECALCVALCEMIRHNNHNHNGLSSDLAAAPPATEGKGANEHCRGGPVRLSLSYLVNATEWTGVDDEDEEGDAPQRMNVSYGKEVVGSLAIRNPLAVSRTIWAARGPDHRVAVDRDTKAYEEGGMPNRNDEDGGEENGDGDGDGTGEPPASGVDDMSTGSDDTLALAAYWIRKCRDTHGCGKHHVVSGSSLTQQIIPMRLLDVSQAATSAGAAREDEETRNGKVFLVSFDSHLSQSPSPQHPISYATLSHRWESSSPSSSAGPPRPPLLLTTSSNQRSHTTDGIPLSSLSPTLSEACVAASKLGLRYIWIDSLCILQDDEADKLKEIPKMAVYYQNAEVNLSASTPGGGLWRRRVGRANRPLAVEVSLALALLDPGLEEGGEDDGLRDHRQHHHSAVLHVAPVLRGPRSHLDSRGWVLQERIFARRTLFFDPRWVAFECGEWSASESCPDGVSTSTSTSTGAATGMGDKEEEPLEGEAEEVALAMKGGGQKVEKALGTVVGRDCGLAVMGGLLSRGMMTTDSGGERKGKRAAAEVYFLWYRAMQEYSQRRLSFESDRLLAVAGLAERFSKAMPDEYVGGMWKGEMLGCLLWVPLRYGGMRRPRWRPYRAPTWSWASLDLGDDDDDLRLDGVGGGKGGGQQRQEQRRDVGVVYEHTPDEEVDAEVTVVAVEWTSRKHTANVYGDLASAKLVLMARPLRGHAYASATGPDRTASWVTMSRNEDGGELEDVPLLETQTFLDNAVVNVNGTTWWYIYICGLTADGRKGTIVTQVRPDVAGGMVEETAYLLPLCRQRIGGSLHVFCLVLRQVGVVGSNGVEMFERVGWAKTNPALMPRAKERRVVLV